MKDSMRRLLGALLGLALVMGLVSSMSPAAHVAEAEEADAGISYISHSESGAEVTGTCTEYTVVTANQTKWVNGWYVVPSEAATTLNNRVKVEGEVHLILCDGSTLSAPCGIHVPEGNSLTIYGQTGGSGYLLASYYENESFENGAAIGGNGRGRDFEECGGTITIHGGKVEATGNDPEGHNVIHAAGIGAAGGSVAIYGGTVTATGGDGAAGIGSGYNYWGLNEDVAIYGGTVTATGGSGAAGIGGGSEYGRGSNVEISGGTVTATGGDGAVGIGAGKSSAEHRLLKVTGGLAVYGGDSAGHKAVIPEESGDYSRYRYMDVRAPVVTLDKGTASVVAGETATLTATVALEGATDLSVAWSSSDTGVATVDANGVVTGLAAGEATITATTTEGGYTATCAVTVVNGRISSARALLGNNISVVMYATFGGGVTLDGVPTMVVTMNGEETNLTGTSGTDGRYSFTFDGINPQNIGDSFSAVMTYKIGDQEYTDTLSGYSVKQYCMTVLESADSLELPSTATAGETKRMVVDILYYGAEAQTYMSHNTDNPATSDLTDAQKALASTYSTPTESEGVVADMLSGTKSDSYYWVSAKANFDNAANLQFYFMAPNGIEGLAVQIDGAEHAIKTTSTSGKYYVEMTQMSADSFRTAHTAKFFVNDAQVGQTLTYSMNTYVKQVESYESFAAFAKRLYNYGESAYAYAHGD